MVIFSQITDASLGRFPGIFRGSNKLGLGHGTTVQDGDVITINPGGRLERDLQLISLEPDNLIVQSVSIMQGAIIEDNGHQHAVYLGLHMPGLGHGDDGLLAVAHIRDIHAMPFFLFIYLVHIDDKITKGLGELFFLDALVDLFLGQLKHELAHGHFPGRNKADGKETG